MLLICDIGNSLIKTGIINNSDQPGELKNFKETDSLINYMGTVTPLEVAVTSVVPEKTKELFSYLKEKKISHILLTHKLNFNLKINYKTPETLGVDRLCSAEGAFYLFKKSREFLHYDQKTSIISIDFGTATTINFVKYPGIFEGGIIAPGINMMFNSLQDKTAQLPEVNSENYRDFIGSDTASSIASGVINSTAGLIEKSLNFLREKLKIKETKIYITGGNAEKIIDHLNFKFEYIRELVLIGAKEIYLRNKKR